MGQLVTTVVGGIGGFLIGGPLGAQIGMTLGGMVGATLFGPTIKGPRLNDLKVSASTYGVAIPEVYGTVRVGGNMLWTSGIKETKKTSRAGKGGPKQTTYTYDASFAVGLCKGPITDITRIWADGKVIYDKTNGSTRNPSNPSSTLIFGVIQQVFGGSSKKKNVNFRVYLGTEEQLPDSLIVADKGAGNVSAHRGMAYVVFEKLQLEDFGNRIPQLTFEVTKALSNSFPSLLVRDSDGTSKLPGLSKRAWYPDWETGRLLSNHGDYGVTVIDMNNMRAVFQSSTTLSGSGRQRFIPGDSQFILTRGLSNSGPIELYNTLSMEKVATYGVTSISLSGFVNVEDNRYGIANYGPSGYGHFKTSSGRGRFIISTSWTRQTWCVNGAQFPIFNHRAPFEPWFYHEGRTDTSSADIIGYRGANGRLEVLNYIIPGGSTYQIIPTVDGPVWKSGPFSANTLYLNPFAGESIATKLMLYDPTDDGLFWIGTVNNVPATFKYIRATGTYKFAVKHPGMPMPMGRMDYSRIAGGTFGWGYAQYRQTGKLCEIDLQTGALVRNVAYGGGLEDQLYFGDGQQWDDVTKSLLVETKTEYRRVFFSAGVAKLTVGGIVRDVCLKSGVLTDADIDITGLNSDTLVGYMIDRETTGRDVIKQLATGFLFDGYESDYKLKFRSRGNNPVVTIPENWIGRNSDGIVVKETITQELEMPMRVTVNHYDTSRDHQQGSQTMKRKAGPVPTMWTNKEDIIDLPITWTPDEAKQCADKILKMQWANRFGYAMELPWRYLKYDPTDVATVNLDDGTVYTMRMTEVNIGADFSIEATAVSEKATAYVSTAKGSVGEAPPQMIPGSFPAFPIIINTPLLRDIDYDTSQNSACYLSAGSNAITFGGAAIFMDDGYDFTAVGVVSNESITGFVQNKLPATKAYESTDDDTILIVRLNDPDSVLESVSQDDMLNNFVNAALIGKEIIQFRDAVKQMDGSWHLSGIIRARRGTNYAVNTHSDGETFLLLDEEAITRFYRPPSDYEISREFKAVPTGTLIEDAIGYPTALSPRDLMPYTPEDIKISDDDTTVTVTMSRRSRVTAPMADNTGDIHYKEGEKVSAKISYKLWSGLTIENTTTVADPNKTGNLPLFDTSGDDIDPVITFPLTDLGGETKFLLRLTEVGVVEGLPKWIAFERIGTNRWNATDLY